MGHVLEMLRNWKMGMRDRAFLADAPPMLFQDIGLARRDALELAAARLDVRDRMVRMAGRHRLDTGRLDANRQASTDAALACGRCTSTAPCSRFLAGSSDADPLDFCPNSPLFRAMAS